MMHTPLPPLVHCKVIGVILDEDDEIIKAENCESVLLESLTNEIQRLSVNAFCQPRKPTQVKTRSSSPFVLFLFSSRSSLPPPPSLMMSPFHLLH